jgi:hypothetical protein
MDKYLLSSPYTTANDHHAWLYECGKKHKVVTVATLVTRNANETMVVPMVGSDGVCVSAGVWRQAVGFMLVRKPHSSEVKVRPNITKCRVCSTKQLIQYMEQQLAGTDCSICEALLARDNYTCLSPRGHIRHSTMPNFHFNRSAQ